MKTAAVLVLSALLLPMTSSPAQIATYNFDSAQWVSGGTTPFFGMPPDSAFGISGLSADFTSGPTLAVHTLSTFHASPNFSGQALMQLGPPGTPGNALTITLDQPVTGVRVDFGQFAPGRFDLTCITGVTSLFTDEWTAYGTMDFQSPIPITQFTLQAFLPDNTPIMMAIDNLVLTIPEPSACSLGIISVWVFAVFRRARAG